MKPCAIAILNYNGRQVLPVFLPSVIQNSKTDVWIIDNASTDDSVEFLKRDFPEVSLIQLKSNFGYAGGYNWGLEELKGKYEYFILLNSDAEVTADWDVDLINWLGRNPDFAALQPKILSWQDRKYFDYAGAGGAFLDSFGYPYCRGRIWDSIELDSGQYDDAVQTDWASGACFVVRSADFFEHGGFDGHFFSHMEEIDLCWRMRNSGRRIGYLGSVTIFHQGGATLDRSSPNKLYLNIRNSLSMVYKNTRGLKFIGVFFVKLVVESLAGLDYLIKGKKGYSAAILKAYRDFFKTRKLLVMPKKKSEYAVTRSGPASFIFWSYFVLGKRKFNQL